MGASARTSAWTRGLVPEVFAFQCISVHKVQIVDFSVPIAYDCPHPTEAAFIFE